MPSFSVRRKVQVDFNVDRRHIYDFYHSRGLRCLKNERSTRAKKREIDTVIIEDPPTSRSRSSRGLPIPDYSEPRRRRRAAPYDIPPSPKIMRKPRKSSSVPDPAPMASSCTELSNSPPSSYAPTPEPSGGHLPSATPVDVLMSAPPSPLGLPEAPPPSPSLSSTGSSSSTDSFESLASMEHYLASLEPVDFNIIVSTADTDNESSGEQPADPGVVPPSPFSLLSPQEKQQPYSWLSNVLGPANGIQECVGSYKQYMDQQRDAYYSPLVDNDLRPLKARVHSVGPTSAASLSSGKPALTSTEATLRAVSRTMRASARTSLATSGLHQPRPTPISRPSTTKPSTENVPWPAVRAPVPVVARPLSASFLQPLRASTSFNMASRRHGAQHSANSAERLQNGASNSIRRQDPAITPSATYTWSHGIAGHSM